jgi:preprotein translocase subunit SecE
MLGQIISYKKSPRTFIIVLVITILLSALGIGIMYLK